MKVLRNIFLTGLAVLLPIIVTVYILIWLGTSAESFLGRLIRFLLPDSLYWPGMGVAFGIALVLAVGLLARMLIVRRLIGWAERILGRIPLVKVIYGSMRDLMSYFSGSEEKGFSQVVIVTLGNTDARVLGFVTRDDLSEFPAGIKEGGRIAVYLPMSYQIGGYTVMIPPSAIQPVAMTMQEAMRFAITGGMITTGAPGKK